MDADPAGSIEAEFSYGNADDFMDLALGVAGWVNTPILENTASATPIAGVATNTNTNTNTITIHQRVGVSHIQPFAGLVVRTGNC